MHMENVSGKLGRSRLTPNFGDRVPSGKTETLAAYEQPLQGNAGAPLSPENKGLQASAAPMQLDEGASPAAKDYPHSVEDVRRILSENKIEKSKDTIQRYCREGDLVCQKFGMLRRFYATDPSVSKLIKKLQPDADASTRTQVYASASKIEEKDLTEKETEIGDHESDLDAPASTRMHPHAAGYDKVVEALTDQLKRKDDQIDALAKSLNQAHTLSGQLQNIFGTTVAALGGKSTDPNDQPEKET